MVLSATPVIRFDEIDSTNAEAHRRAEAGESGPLWLTAAVQTAGRGRRGRVWETVTGNLAATYLFTTPKPPAEAAQVSFVAALAAHDLAFACPPIDGSELGPVMVSLKWPNDLLVNGRKAAGILVESGRLTTGLWVAVGMGINLAVAPEAAPGAAIVPTSFRAEGLAMLPPLEALAILDEALRHWLAVWTTEGFPAVAAAWTARAHGLGQACTARMPTETVVGTAEGLDDDGALRMRLDDGSLRRITAGDVFFGGTI